jgi:hypothetical protein
MATPAQIDANRANAQKSTGPRSVESKSVSRCNAPGEDPADYDALAAHYQRDCRPETPSEALHADGVMRNL